jgi:hypothetical protein
MPSGGVHLQRLAPVFSAVPSRSHRFAPDIRLHRLNAMAEWTSVAIARA